MIDRSSVACRARCVSGAWLAAGACALVAAGCVSTLPAPTAQLAAADVSVEAAATSGAQVYAPTELRLASDKLLGARRALAEGDHGAALQMAEQAEVDAQLALGITRSARARKAADLARADARALREERQRHASRPPLEGTR